MRHACASSIVIIDIITLGETDLLDCKGESLRACNVFARLSPLLLVGPEYSLVARGWSNKSSNRCLYSQSSLPRLFSPLPSLPLT